MMRLGKYTDGARALCYSIMKNNQDTGKELIPGN